jgi:hypothetical protein
MSTPTSPTVIPPTLPPVSNILSSLRPGLTLTDTAGSLGPLADLAGTWIGNGFTLISLPDFDSKLPSTGRQPFRLKLNSTVEILEFVPIGAEVPNRGSTIVNSDAGQRDINIFGLRYLQRIADSVTHQPLHIEPGFWLNVPKTDVPPLPTTVVRQGTIPHGNSLLALGIAPPPLPGGPRIGVVDSTPTRVPPDTTPFGPHYLDPFISPPLPAGFKLPFVKDLNLALKEAIQGQRIAKTVTLPISTDASTVGFPDQNQGGGGIVNMPFDIKNAEATRLDAVFWIETVRNPDGSTFLQLQYTQTVNLRFIAIDWPHISVATLTKQ